MGGQTPLPLKADLEHLQNIGKIPQQALVLRSSCPGEGCEGQAGEFSRLLLRLWLTQLMLKADVSWEQQHPIKARQDR